MGGENKGAVKTNANLLLAHLCLDPRLAACTLWKPGESKRNGD
jgi:hypothetical protein